MTARVPGVVVAGVLGLIAVTAPVSAVAQTGLNNSEMLAGFQFNFNNPGARSLGMGGAFIGLADDATAAVANPGGLPILQRPELSAEIKRTTFTNEVKFFRDLGGDRFESREFDDSVWTPSFFSFVYPLENVTLAAFIRQPVNFESTFFTANDTAVGLGLFPVTSRLEVSTLNLGVGFGLNLAKNHPLLPNVGASIEFAYGSANGRLIRSSGLHEIVDGSDTGVGFNAGLLWRPWKDLGVGAVYRRGPKFDFEYRKEVPGLLLSRSFDLGLKVPDVWGGGVSYRFFDRLTITADVVHVMYSQLVDDFQIVFAGARAKDFTVKDATEFHLGAEYIFFVRSIPVAARAGFFTDPDHKIRYHGPSAVDRALFRSGDDAVHYTGGLGFVPFPGVQFDAAVNWSETVKEFSFSTIFRF